MKRGTAAKVILGKDTLMDVPAGIVHGTDVILGGKAGLLNDFGGLVLSNNLMIGKKVSRSTITTVTVRGQSPLVLPDAISGSLQAVKAFGGTEQSNLPAGYTQLEYIESSGTQYIDLGYKGNENTKVDIKFKYYAASSATSSGRVFGSRTSSQDDAFAIGTSSGVVSSTNNKIFWCYDGQPYFVWDTGFGLDVWKTVVFSATEHSIDGVSVGNDYNIVEFETSRNLKLFGFDNNGTMGVGYVDIAYCKLWDNGVLVRDLVPAKNSSNVVGMYDLVSGQFLTNAGTGDFTAGAVAVPVPTPDAPMDIVSNNGVLKVSPNLFDVNDLNIGSVASDIVNYKSYAVPNGTYTMSTPDFPLQNITANIFFLAGNVSSGASSASNGVLQGTSRTINVSDGYYTVGYRSGLTNPDNPKDYSWQIEQGSTATPYMPYGQVYADGTVETINVHGKNLIDVADYTVPSGSGTNTLWTGSMTGTFRLSVDTSKVTSVGYPNQRFLYVVVNDSGTYINYSDCDSIAISGTLTRIACIGSTGYARVSGKISLQLERGTTTTPYEPYYNGGTATTEMLLKIGDYQDEQEILSGVVTRKVKALGLDGTENWALAQSTSTMRRYSALITPDVAKNNADSIGFSTHFECKYSNVVGAFYFSAVKALQLCVDESINTVELFKQWLADQYAAGTPVIVIYPLATPITESVTGQALQVTDGDNVLEITQAGMDGLELEATYKSLVQLTIQEVEDANLNNNVEVTIS